MAGSSLQRSNVAAPAAVTSSPATPVPSPLETPIGQMIAPYRAHLEPFLRGGVTLEQALTELYLASLKVPNLDKCAPIELVNAVSRALLTGGTIGKDVYILPYYNSERRIHEPSVIIDYKFEAHLVCLTGAARSIDAENVYQGEIDAGVFEMELGNNPFLRHKPHLVQPSKRGAQIGSYAIAHIGHGHAAKIKWMSFEEIEQLRKSKSQKWKTGECPPWYGPKSCVHRVTDLLPQNPQLRAFIEMRSNIEDHGVVAADPDPALPSSTVAALSAPAPGTPPNDSGAIQIATNLEDESESEDSPDVNRLPLEQAMGLVVNKKALGEYRNKALQNIIDFATNEIEQKGDDAKLAQLIMAVKDILAARAAGKLQEPPKLPF